MSDDYTKVGLLKNLFRAITGGDIVDQAVDTTSECIDQFCKFYDGHGLSADLYVNKLGIVTETISGPITTSSGEFSTNTLLPKRNGSLPYTGASTLTSLSTSIVIGVDGNQVVLPASAVGSTDYNTFDLNSWTHGHVRFFGYYFSQGSLFEIKGNWSFYPGTKFGVDYRNTSRFWRCRVDDRQHSSC